MLSRKKRKILKPHAGYTRFNNALLIRGGSDYFEKMLHLISNAKFSVHLQVYIFDEDETGTMVADALVAAALRGVKVYVLVDGYASRTLSFNFRKRLRDAGIFFRLFEPVLRTKNFYFGRRMHHKILVVDSWHSLVGGINISNKYNDFGGKPSWLDWAVYAEGEISFELQKICVRLFTRSYVKADRILSLEGLRKSIYTECLIRLRRNDWVRNKTQIVSSYFEMFRNAEKNITIMSSYFLPGYQFRRQLSKVTRRNVEVKLILAGLSDVPIAKHAERFIYRWLLRNGIRIYEYQPSVLHGKIATYDNKWSTVGSFNVNNISAFASIELNLDINDREFSTVLERRFRKIIEMDCIEITSEFYRTHFSLAERFIQWLSYTTVRVLFYLFTFYFRQKE